MNVTSKGYFTSQYLDKKKQMSPRYRGYHEYDVHDELDDYSFMESHHTPTDLESAFEYNPSLGFPYSPKQTPPGSPKASVESFKKEPVPRYDKPTRDSPRYEVKPVERKENREGREGREYREYREYKEAKAAKSSSSLSRQRPTREPTPRQPTQPTLRPSQPTPRQSSQPTPRQPPTQSKSRPPSPQKSIDRMEKSRSIDRMEKSRSIDGESKSIKSNIKIDSESKSIKSNIKIDSESKSIKSIDKIDKINSESKSLESEPFPTSPKGKRKVDPDFLEQNLTPAELNIINNRYMPHRNSRRSPYLADPSKHLRKYDQYYERQKHKYDDYYARQSHQQESSRASVKPKMYTPRTFKDVFVNKEESLDKYNPMEFVFDSEERTPSQLQKAYRNIRVRLGKEDDSYDYWKQREEQLRQSSEEEEEEEEERPGSKESAEEREERPGSESAEAKNKRLKKLWRKNMEKARRELARNFKNERAYGKEYEVRENWPEESGKPESVKPESVKPESVKPDSGRPESVRSEARPESVRTGVSESVRTGVSESVRTGVSESRTGVSESVKEGSVKEGSVKSSPSNLSLGESPRFHPLWNAVLRYLVYKAEDNGHEVDNIEVEEVEEPKKTSAAARHLNTLKKGYNMLTANWNQPVSTLLKEPEERSVYSLPQSMVLDTAEEDPQEFTLEIDDDEITQELYFNPVTKQLEPAPPTSQNSMAPDSRFRSLLRHFDPSSSVVMISNLNRAIKNIQVMRMLFAPIDVVAEMFPTLQTVVIVVELLIFLWVLYELSRLVDAVCMMVKAVCAPMIAMGRLMNRIV